MKRGLLAFSAPQVASLRIFFTALIFLPFLPRALRQARREDLLPILTVGFFGSALPPFLFTAAQTHINSATAGILNALSPLFTLLVGLAAFGLAFNRQKLLGILIGFVGAASLIIHTAQGSQASDYSYGGYVVLATLCYGISINTVTAKCRHLSPFTINAISFSTSGIFISAYLFSTDFLTRCQTQPDAATSLLALFILSLFGTAIASIIYFKLAQRTDALFSSMTTYLMPIVSIILGILDGEAIDMIYFMGIGLILSGIYLVQKQ